MPALTNLSYQRPKLFFSAHLETIFPAFFRTISNIPPAVIERINTPDRDFLDIYWRKQGANKIVIIQHGLEGSADRPYILGMAKCFFNSGYDTLTWNYRGCGEEMNKTDKFYHSGATYDLELVVNQALPHYDEIYLVGFSLGGNLTLKYLGERNLDAKIKKAVVISAPLDLDAGVKNLQTSRGLLYDKHFVRKLKQKVKLKNKLYPDQVTTRHLGKIKTLRDFDEYYTAPLHGYKDADDYYRQCSSKFFLADIKVPTLILNAINDPILSKESHDHALTKNLRFVTMETTQFGGHVGYTIMGTEYYWSERRAVDFCAQT